MADLLAQLRDAHELAPIDEQLARGLARIGNESRDEVALAVAMTSRAVRYGHVCFDVRRFAAPRIEGANWPAVAAWLDVLRVSPLVGDATSFTPLVIEGERLYLRRYFRYETGLAEHLRARIERLEDGLDAKSLRASLNRLFPRVGLASDEVDRQRLAALVAVARGFCIISGGPGTGKTTTVVKILALLAEQALLAGRARLHATLVAPTGKAAARLQEAILQQRATLDLDERVRTMVPTSTSTIHRALKPIPGSVNRFRHNADNPLATDVLIVDEASMVDIALMSRLVDALPPHARLILLGDRNQLASVEAGAISGDLGGPPRPATFSPAFVSHIGKLTGDTLPAANGSEPPIADCVVQLERNYRYAENSGIAELARAVNAGEAPGALSVLESGADDVRLHDAVPRGHLGVALHRCVIKGYTPFLTAQGEHQCFDALGRFRVLAAHRRGPHGVEKLNPLIAEALADEGLLRPTTQWYVRRPILVTENEYQVGLFNGDVGLVLPDPDDDDAVRAWFVTPQGVTRKLAPSRLPPHETVFAMTVHKAQGSEFEEVAVILPSEVSPIATRELLYTAITRPRKRVTLFACKEVISASVLQPVERASGLRARLWK